MHYKQPEAFYKQSDFIKKIIKECPKDQFIPVYSAFNGFAIYRSKVYLDCVYDGTNRTDLIPPYLLTKQEEILGKSTPYYWSMPGAKLIGAHTDEVIPIAPEQDCEHRSFHLYGFFIKGARNVISTDIIFQH